MNRFQLPFQPIGSTAPSFEVSADSTSIATALESTGPREWSGAGSRSVRIANAGSNAYHYAFGSSLAVAASTDSVMLLGGVIEVFSQPRPQDTHIAFVSSTDVVVNVTIGYGY